MGIKVYTTSQNINWMYTRDNSDEYLIDEDYNQALTKDDLINMLKLFGTDVKMMEEKVEELGGLLLEMSWRQITIDYYIYIYI